MRKALDGFDGDAIHEVCKMKMIFFGRCWSSSNDDGCRTWVFSLVLAFSRVYVYTQESRDVGLSSCRRRVVASILLCLSSVSFYHAVYLRLRLFPRTHLQLFGIFFFALSNKIQANLGHRTYAKTQRRQKGQPVRLFCTTPPEDYLYETIV